MIATFAVEKLTEHGDYKLDGIIEIEVPFAKSNFNFVLELVAAVGSYLQKTKARNGVYRIGTDEAAKVEWLDGSPKLLSDVRTLDNSAQAAIVAAVMEANRERN